MTKASTARVLKRTAPPAADLDSLVDAIEAQRPSLESHMRALRDAIAGPDVPREVQPLMISATRVVLRKLIGAYSSLLAPLHELDAFCAAAQDALKKEGSNVQHH